MIKTIENRYDGVIVDQATLPDVEENFKNEITSLITSLRGKKLLWINIPIQKSKFIPILARLDFEFHHCDEGNVMLVKKLSADAFIPTTKNYIVGVGAIVLDGDKLLVVRDRFSVDYKLPGGHIDKNEAIKDAVKREVYEETGVSIEFESIMNIGHFRGGQFGESNLYIVCTAKALTNEIAIMDSSEVADAKWMDIDDFLKSEEVNNYNKSVVKAAMENTDLKLIDQPVKLRIAGGEVFF